MFSSPSPPHSLNIGCNISNNASGVTLWLVIIFLLQFIVNINFECKAIFERSKFEAVWLSDNKPRINKFSHLFNKTYVHKMYHPLLWLTLMLLLCQEKMCKVFFLSWWQCCSHTLIVRPLECRFCLFSNTQRHLS